jgi:hypothetical protein
LASRNWITALLHLENALSSRLGKRSEGRKSINILRFSSKEASRKLEKLVLSVIANWQKKTLMLIWKKLVYLLKRLQWWWNDVEKTSSSPQGRAHRIRKRSNHVTIGLLIHTQAMGQRQIHLKRLGIIRGWTQTGMVEMITW